MKATYQTQQRKALLDFLQTNREHPMTAAELSEELKEQVPMSSLYRLLKKLEEEGLVRKCTMAGERTAAYQLVESKECHSHLHLQCTGCGKLVHLSKEATKKTKQLMSGEDGFDLDYEKTLLYGVCRECKFKGQSEA